MFYFCIVYVLSWLGKYILKVTHRRLCLFDNVTQYPTYFILFIVVEDKIQ